MLSSQSSVRVPGRPDGCGQLSLSLSPSFALSFPPLLPHLSFFLSFADVLQVGFLARPRSDIGLSFPRAEKVCELRIGECGVGLRIFLAKTLVGFVIVQT